MRDRYRAVLAALLLVALVGAPVAAAPAASGDGARAEHRRIVKFWTPARMRAAVPREFVRTPRGLEPAAKPEGTGKPGGGGGDGGGTVTGASWTKGGEVRDAVGKVFFRLSGTLYTCSGSVTDDSRTNYSLVLTAAHCAYDESKDAFATDWLFIPDYESAPTRTCDNTKHGCWTALGLVVHEGYAGQSSFNSTATRHDFAFAVVGAGGKSGQSKQLDATVGSFPITFNAVSEGTRMYAFGYPAAGKYKGNKLIHCAGPVFHDSWNASATYGLECDMTGGASGGPWFSDFDEGSGSGTQRSLNSYRYQGVKAIYGPKFNAKTQAVYAAADGVTSNTIVS
jgi:V8-like Glu-specific endopeptidase